ncbi:hypothetical protein [Jiangella gansuensis]|uniref:hypothetical protein n=1 Tax=Jiangella gansuensis TaxID=281473 RepID=UPI00047DFD31|nr:hypothetical protein [Jiangella gansuensis]
MRFPAPRTVAGVALIVLGTPPLLAGAVVAGYVGPDDTVDLVRRDVSTESSVISTAVSMTSFTGPVLHVSADAGDTETFVGVAHQVHVDSYLQGVAQETVTDLTPRGELTLESSGPDAGSDAGSDAGAGEDRDPDPGGDADLGTDPDAEADGDHGTDAEGDSGTDTDGDPGTDADGGFGTDADGGLGTDAPAADGPAAPPGDLDWWQESSSGAGRQAVTFELTDVPLRAVVMTPSAAGALDVALGIDVEIDGLFVTAVLVGVAGLLLVVGGVLILWLRRRRRKRELRVVPPLDRGEQTKPPAAAEPPDKPADKDSDKDSGYDDRDGGTPPADGAGDAEPEREKIATVTPLPRRTPLSDRPRPQGAPTPPEPTPPPEGTAPPEGTPAPPAPPPPPKPKPSARARIVVALGLSGLVTACAQVPQEISDADRVSSIPAITPDRAGEFFTAFGEASTEASAALDATLLADVAGGTLLETTQFAYEERLTTGDAPAVEPLDVTPGTLLSPRVDAYPMWAVVTGEPGDGAAPPWFLLTRETAASPWLASLAVQPAAATSITPPVTGEDGAAVVADEDMAARGQEVLDALIEYGETGVEPERVDLTNADGVTRLPQHGLQLDTAPPEFGTVARSCAIENPDDIHWLTTEYGAVTLASISCTQTMSANPGYSVVIEADGLGTIPGGSEINQAEISQSASFVLSVDTDGSATVTGQRMQPLSMTWSLP